MKKLALLILILISLSYVAVYRTASYYPDRQLYPQTKSPNLNIDIDAVSQRLSQAIQIPTISREDSSNGLSGFTTLHQFLQAQFPRIHQLVTPKVINQASLVYEFKGSNASLKPILLMGHLDVVPVDQATLNKWQQPPFSGAVENGQIWGRGALDDKSSVMAIMEAMEMLLTKNKKLQRSVFFAFGHDEEIGGEQGAAAIAEYFKQRKLKFEFVLDEGGAIVQDIIAGFDQPIALIGVAEKGFVNIRMTVNAAGGHSSMPPKHTAAGILAKAIVKLEASPFPADLKFTNLIFDAIGHYADFPTRIAMANQWLLAPIIRTTMLETPSTAAGLRTSTAVTMLEGSSKSNILPTQASAVANFRIFPGETWQSVLQRVKQIVDDSNVKLEAFMQSNPSPISDHRSNQYELIANAIREIAPNTLVAPYLVQGGTDAKYFYDLSDQVYRFLMIRMTPDTLQSFHGINEKISVEDYADTIRFFSRILERSTMSRNNLSFD